MPDYVRTDDVLDDKQLADLLGMSKKDIREEEQPIGTHDGCWRRDTHELWRFWKHPDTED